MAGPRYIRAFERHRLERAARLCHSNADAALSLGCNAAAFARACGQYGIETPAERGRRQSQKAMARRRQKDK